MIKTLCDNLKMVFEAEGLKLTDQVTDSALSKVPLSHFMELHGDNSLLFKKYVCSFQCESLAAGDYVQWNEEVFEQGLRGLRFYLGASGTSAFAIVENGLLTAVEEMDGDDGFVTRFDSFEQWLQQHCEMCISSYTILSGHKKPWWKFW